MKNILKFKASFFLILLCFTVQCSTDKATIKPKEVISSASQLAADSSFISMVQTNRRLTSVLFEKMRLLGSDAARKEQALKINELINTANSQDNSKALAKQFGFETREELIDFVSAIVKREIELETRYSNYTSTEQNLKKEAYLLVANTLTVKEKVQKASRSNEVCVLCYFNNCSECFGDEQVETPNSGDTGGGGYSCKREAGIIRENSRTIAGSALVAAFVGCGWTAFEAGGYAGTVTLNPGVALGVGGGVIAVCDLMAMLTYTASINVIESNYRTTLNGCRD